VQIQLDAASASVNETAGSVTLSVSRLGGMKGAVSVNFSTANGSAIAGQDYSGASGTLTWANNDTAAKTITVPITNDNLLEGNETFTVNLSSPTAGAGLGTSSETVTIVNSLRPGACANLLNGTSGNDTLTGSSAGDNILGLGGNDVLAGLSGSDCLSGGTGNDKLSGGTGNDRISGGSGKDRISGGSGKDTLSGSSGNDSISGGSSNDRIAGGSGSDRISGGSGSDRISVGSGKNRVSAGKGNDVVNAVNGKRDRINCGPGRRDRVRANRRDVLSGCEIVRLVR
jgi:Ca2+-binding RTX toxin-like protein